jgi:hypothetical protein
VGCQVQEQHSGAVEARRYGATRRGTGRQAELIAQVEALELENKRLRDRMIGMMLKADPLLSPEPGRRKPRDR